MTVKTFLISLLLTSLRLMAKLQLAKISLIQNLKGHPLKIIGVTGSAGKTSTLLAIEAALTPNFKVRTGLGANSEYGIPLSILGIKVTGFTPADYLKYLFLSFIKIFTNWQSYQVLVIEMGIDSPDEPQNMSYLLKIVKPHIGIFLNVNPVHSAQFDKTVSKDIKGEQRLHQILSNIAAEKAKLIISLPPTGHAILNLTDPHVTASTLTATVPKLTIGDTSSSTLRPLNSRITPDAYSTIFNYSGKKYTLTLNGFALPSVYTVTLSSALLTSLALGLNLDTAIKNLENNFSLPHSRSSLLKGIKNTTIIDSSYNSSPLATQEMLQLLSLFPAPRIAILGDMRELGIQSENSHKRVFKTANLCADQIIGVGPETKKYFKTSPKGKTITFDYWWQATDYLTRHLKGGETLLVKGSQNTIFLEELVKSLLANPSDSSKLCRQSPHWQAIKTRFRTNSS